MADDLLVVKDLTVEVIGSGRPRPIVKDVSFRLSAASILALVGGSGSGKTTTGLSILRLLPPALRIVRGEIVFGGQSLLGLDGESMRRLRGRRLGMVFQEPLSAMNPVFSVGEQIEEVLRFHTDLAGQKRREAVLDLLDRVEIPDPRRVYQSYPHQLSGGMRQRAMIAQAIAASPGLIIADEPTSSLDVTLQVRIMDLFRKLRKEMDLSIVLITHDLGVVAHLADEAVVLSGGEVVESGSVAQVLGSPKHPYTCRLLETLKV
ncbi:MAG: ABC transporter ATP-binding protein [Candidatus Omnitrophota bacterium]|nr:ABC transporter ATP-binding protein [Candidatus Omnitrophota bacterium]MDZ4242133.1 ABC transporter ATP-binding protein [Candidatus Omnitrophota bacterium]